MDLFGSFGPPQTNQNVNQNQGDPLRSFYSKLFTFFDKGGVGAIQGKQIFGFFVTSNVNKKVLADIWDESTQKQKGGLNLDKFIVAMKLIGLAQKGIAPKRINLQNNTNIPPPIMQYPPGIQPPQNINLSDNNSTNNDNKGNDAFADLTQSFGLSTNNNANQNKPKPAGPSWGPLIDNNNNENDQKSVNNGATPNNLTIQANAPINVQQIPNTQTTPIVAQVTQVGSQGPGSIGNNDNSINQYAPPSTFSQPKRQQTLILIDDVGVGVGVGGTQGKPYGLNRQASKTLYTEERLREQIRAAEQREKMVRKQLNDARILNEKLQRENDEIQREIKDARIQQAQALKQSTENLSLISPLKLENEKLKQAITQWKELITRKEQEMEELEKEIEELRINNEKIENTARDDKTQLEDNKLQLDRTFARLKEEEEHNKNLENQILELKKEKITIEDDKRNLELELITKKDEIKKLKRKQLNNKDTSQLQNNLMSGFSSNFMSPSSNNNNVSNNNNKKEDQLEQDFEHDSDSEDKTKNKKDEVMLDSDLLVDLPDSRVLPPKSNGLGISSTNDDNNNNKNNNSNPLDLFAGIDLPETKPEEQPGKNEIKISPKQDFDDNMFGPGAYMAKKEKKKEKKKVKKAKKEPKPEPPQQQQQPPVMINNPMDNESEEEEYEVSEFEDVEIEEEVPSKETKEISEEILFDENYKNDKWYIKESDRAKYEKFFKQADLNKDGFVDGGEANKFFSKSKMDRKKLAMIWSLVDYTKKGKLDKWMFFAMFKMVFKIVQSKGKESIPKELPASLQTEIIQKYGTKVVTSKTIEVDVVKKVKKIIKKKVKVKKKRKKPKKNNNNINNNNNNNKTTTNDDFGDDFGDFGDFGGGNNESNNKGNDIDFGPGPGNNVNNDDFGGGFDDFGDFGGDSKPVKKNDDKKKDKKKDDKKAKKDDFGGFDDAGFGDFGDFGADFDSNF